MTNIFNTLTDGEQQEIRQYIRDRLSGKEIDVDKLPQWLSKLEIIKRKHVVAKSVSQIIDNLRLKVEERERLVEILGLALAEHNHQWTTEERSLFDKVVGDNNKGESND